MSGAAAMPEPVRGGTWIYCRHEWDVNRSGRTIWFTCPSRFRRLKKYRRHWRKFHAGQSGG